MKSILAFSALLLIAFAGCGGSDSSSSSTSDSGSPTASYGKIEIKDFEFVPKAVTVKAGTPITWTNKDSAAHTATVSGPNGGFDTGTLQEGVSKTVKVKPGTYHYVCGIHPFMKATLTVK
jgi:plastocyanin